MKKVIVLASVVGFLFVGSSYVSAAEEVGGSDVVEHLSQNRGLQKKKWFSSYPPKTYNFNGAKKALIKAVKSNGGYFGFYQ